MFSLRLVAITNDISTPNKEIIDNIVDSSIKHIISENIYYQKDNINLYTKKLPKELQDINIDDYLNEKQKVIYWLNENKSI